MLGGQREDKGQAEYTGEADRLRGEVHLAWMI